MLATLAFALLDDANEIVHPVDNSPVTITWTPSEPNANWAATDPEYIVTSEPASSDVRITMNPHAIDWERPHPSDPLHTLEVQP